MKTSEEILCSVLKTAQMGQVGIRSVEGYAVGVGLKEALSAQKKEYDTIEQEAYRIAASRGWDLTELSPVSKVMSRMCASGNLMMKSSDSKIAAMMINGNTKGLIKGLKNLHHGSKKDQGVTGLMQRLIDCETANIQQMQGYI